MAHSHWMNCIFFLPAKVAVHCFRITQPVTIFCWRYVGIGKAMPLLPQLLLTGSVQHFNFTLWINSSIRCENDLAPRDKGTSVCLYANIVNNLYYTWIYSVLHYLEGVLLWHEHSDDKLNQCNSIKNQNLTMKFKQRRKSNGDNPYRRY